MHQSHPGDACQRLSYRLILQTLLYAAFPLLFIVLFDNTCRALPISSDVQPIESGYSLRVILDGETLVDERHSAFLDLVGAHREEATSTSRFGESMADAFTDVGASGGRPYAKAVATMEVVDDSHLSSWASTGVSRLVYGFAIQSRDPSATLVNQIPISIDVRSQLSSTVNSQAVALVEFYRGQWESAGGNIIEGYDVFGEQLWRHYAAAPLLDEGVIDNHEIKTNLIDLDAQYFFHLTARANAQKVLDDVSIAYAYADPVVEFDQAAFDEMMGSDTFPLNEYFTIVYSPGAERFDVPEPTLLVMVVSAIAAAMGFRGLAALGICK